MGRPKLAALAAVGAAPNGPVAAGRIAHRWPTPRYRGRSAIVGAGACYLVVVSALEIQAAGLHAVRPWHKWRVMHEWMRR
jgi:hypothetical protein